MVRRATDQENYIMTLSEEIDRLNKVIEKKNAEIGNIAKKLSDNEFIMDQNTHESENFKSKIHQLIGENNSVGEELRNAQDNLRASASQVTKLTYELKHSSNENEDLQKRIKEAAELYKRIN